MVIISQYMCKSSHHVVYLECYTIFVDQLYLSKAGKNIFTKSGKKLEKKTIFFFKQTKAEKICCWQSYTTKIHKGSFLGRRRMIQIESGTNETAGTNEKHW